MKKIKSLVAAFTVAAAGMVGMGAQRAEAQTVPVYGGQDQVYSMPASSAQVSQGAIDDLAYNVGVQTFYYRTGTGFTQGWAADGEHIGLQFQLEGANARVTRAYNLDDPNSAWQFQTQVNNASMNENRLADEEYRIGRRVYTYYEPERYVICAPVVPIIGIGWVIGGWYPGYVPVYHRWGGFWDDHGHRNYNHNTTIINNNTTIIERGGNRGGNNGQWNNGQWNHGGNNGQWNHGGNNGGQWDRNGGRHDAHPVVTQPPVRQHFEQNTRPIETHPVQQQPRIAQPRFEQPRFEQPRHVEMPRNNPTQVVHQGGGERGGAIVRQGGFDGGGMQHRGGHQR